MTELLPRSQRLLIRTLKQWQGFTASTQVRAHLPTHMST